MSDKQVTVGDLVFSDIDSNEFLKQLYANLLHNYSIYLLGLDPSGMREVDIESALRFADLLSKSTSPEKRDQHRVWAQEIALLCHTLFPDNPYTRAYVPAVFTTLGNYPALQRLGMTTDAGILATAFEAYQSAYLTVPGIPETKFFAPQKKIYDHIEDENFSFSAPTSLGKSFIIRTFIRTQIEKGAQQNFAIIVPSKALINETRSKLINGLGDGLASFNYRVVTAAGEIALEGQHNFLFVLTPERLLYLLIEKPNLRFDYVFFDESQKLCGKNKRAPFYYQTVTLLQQAERPPKFVFASPNIPNPEVFLRLVHHNEDANYNLEESFATQYSPVIQFKFLVDVPNRRVANYNDRTGELIDLAQITGEIDLNGMLEYLKQNAPNQSAGQTLIFHSSTATAVENARRYAEVLPDLHDPELDQLAKDIERDVHTDYYLRRLIPRGIAYHIGYLPPAIRERIEDKFREGRISALFSTNTLLEGVNLPADNLIITKTKIARKELTPVDFKNLLGRVGRIEYNLYGNIFILAEDENEKRTAANLLEAEVPAQKLSIETDPEILKNIRKKELVASFAEGNIEILRNRNETQEVYEMRRKFGLILLRDIIEDRPSIVRSEFKQHLTPELESTIRQVFKERESQQDDDINVSLDQSEAVEHAIRDEGLAYPTLILGRFDFNQTLEFLNKLAKIFKWEFYESGDLGKSKNGAELRNLRWYTVLLNQWMEGHGLRSIMNRAIEFYQHNPAKFYVDNRPSFYADTLEHRNIVFKDSLETIERIILFKLSNYFLKFSNEYKRVHNLEHFENDWYEYVEYGTTNPQTILLQRAGFSRESATWIRKEVTHPLELREGAIYLNPQLLECKNFNVRKEAGEIKYNLPEAFSRHGFMF